MGYTVNRLPHTESARAYGLMVCTFVLTCGREFTVKNWSWWTIHRTIRRARNLYAHTLRTIVLTYEEPPCSDVAPISMHKAQCIHADTQLPDTIRLKPVNRRTHTLCSTL